MKNLFQSSIRAKLMLVMFIVTGLAMLTGFSIVFYTEVEHTKKSLLLKTQLVAKTVGNYSVTDLAFADVRTGQETLSQLRHLPNIVDVRLYDKNNQLFVSLSNNSSKVNFNHDINNLNRFDNGILRVAERIEYQDEFYGTIFLEISDKELRETIKSNVFTLIFLLLVTLMFAYILAARLQGIISTPILDLERLALRVTEKNDYSIRISVTGTDEISSVHAAFNNMLQQIQDREIARDESEAKLRQSEEKWRSLTAYSPDYILLVDTNGVIQFQNRPLPTNGLNQLMGKSFFAIIPDSCISEVKDCHQKVIQTSRAQYYEISMANPDMQINYYEFVVGPVVEADKVIALTLAGRDITKRKQIENELDKHRVHLEELIRNRTAKLAEQAKIIDQTHDAVVSTDLEGYIKTWNHGAERLFGYANNEILGKNMSILFPNEMHDTLQVEIISSLQQLGELEREVNLIQKDGIKFPANLSLSMLVDNDNKPSGMVAYALDISKRKKTEELLKQRSRDLEIANEELESFSYSVSHDLRAPLRCIDGFSFALLQDYETILDENGKDYLNRVRAASGRMGQLIDDLLMLAKINKGELVITEVNLNPIAYEVYHTLQDSFPNRNVTFAVKQDIKINADKKLLRIILENIISNAWKYTSKKETAFIEIEGYNQDGQQIICVRDNGAGFDMNHYGKLFGVFQRLHSPGEFEGTGIGLATVARIVNRHGGKIWADSKLGEGSTFYFTLNTQHASKLVM